MTVSSSSNTNVTPSAAPSSDVAESECAPAESVSQSQPTSPATTTSTVTTSVPVESVPSQNTIVSTSTPALRGAASQGNTECN